MHARPPARRAGAAALGPGGGVPRRVWLVVAAVVVAAVTIVLLVSTRTVVDWQISSSPDATTQRLREPQLPATLVAPESAAPVTDAQATEPPAPTTTPTSIPFETAPHGTTREPSDAAVESPASMATSSSPVPTPAADGTSCPAAGLARTEVIVPRRLPIAPLIAAWMAHEHERREWTVVDAGAGLGYFTSGVVEAAFGPASDFAAAFGRRALGMAAVEYSAIEVSRPPCDRVAAVGGLGCDASVVFKPDDLYAQSYNTAGAASAANWTFIQIEGGSRNAEFLKGYFSSSFDPLAAAGADAIARRRHAATAAAAEVTIPGADDHDDAARAGAVVGSPGSDGQLPDAELGGAAEPMAVADDDPAAAVNVLEAAAMAKAVIQRRTVPPKSPAGRGRAAVAAKDSRLRFHQRHAAVVPEASGSLFFPEYCAFGEVGECRALDSARAKRQAPASVGRDGKLHINQPTPTMPLEALLPRRFRQGAGGRDAGATGNPPTSSAAMIDVLSLDLNGLGLAVATHSKLVSRGRVRLLVVDLGPTTTSEYAKTAAAAAAGPTATAKRLSKRERAAVAAAAAAAASDSVAVFGEMVRDGLEFLHRHGYACFAAVEKKRRGGRQCGDADDNSAAEEEPYHQHAPGHEEEVDEAASHDGGPHRHGRSFVPLTPVSECWGKPMAAQRYAAELRGARVVCAARSERALLTELQHNTESTPAPVLASHEVGGPECCRHPVEGFRHLAAAVLSSSSSGKKKPSLDKAPALSTSTAYPTPAWLWATEAFRGADECPATIAPLL